ncbi:unnamed protein product [Cyprideis torosa]|uniref:Uncharacterized protein n=1 Tax=Cyprideis torosa TaxID=163714 RepID=A0A7R8ZLE6_9CRUS|nr:unnamed protein product [Cyprideis torosa]CAG0886535.1 unnamed protein product [Cyprideis torosa]
MDAIWVLLLVVSCLTTTFARHPDASPGSDPRLGEREWLTLNGVGNQQGSPDVRFQPQAPHRGIYYELPPPSGSNFASRPWEPGYPGTAGDDAWEDYNYNAEEEQEPTFDRGQPEVEAAFLMPVFHQKRDDDNNAVHEDDISKTVEEPKAMARVQRPKSEQTETDSVKEIYFVAAVAGCSAAMAVGVVAAGMCWYKMRRNSKAAAEAAYPAYGVTGPSKTPDLSPTGSISSGDRKLAQSAQMYHYQHQKQQMIAMETNGGAERQSNSDVESDDDHEEEGEYTVYECPGLAPTGEMEVKNPLFDDQPTPIPGEHP